MLDFVTAPFLCILVALIGFKFCHHCDRKENEKRKKEMLENWEELETQLKEFGADKEDIAMAKQYFPF
jgi:hypothetical protein